MYRSNAFRVHNVHPLSLPPPAPLLRPPSIRLAYANVLYYVNLRRRTIIFLRALLSSRIIIFGEHLFSRTRLKEREAERKIERVRLYIDPLIMANLGH